MTRKRVPVLLGQSANDCAAACLAMIASASGRHTTVAEATDLVGIGRDGVTAAALVEAAARVGISLRAYTIAEFDLAPTMLPVVVHWRFNHWLVVERVRRDRVDVIDPAVGRTRLTRREFDDGFTGVVLVPRTAPGFQLRARSRRAWWPYLRALTMVPGVRSLTVILVGAAVVVQALTLVGPAVTAMVVDAVSGGGQAKILTATGIAVILFAITRLGAAYLRELLLLSLRTCLDAATMTGFFAHVLSLPYRTLQRRPSGDLLMRLTSNVAIRDTLANGTLSTLLDGITLVGLTTVLVVASPVFALAVLAVVAVPCGVVLGTAATIRRRVGQELTAQAASESYLVESLNGITTIKAAGVENQRLARWETLLATELRTSAARQRVTGATAAVTSTVTVFAPLAMLWFGVTQVMAGALSLGSALALVSIGSSVVVPFTSLLGAAQQLQFVGGQLERLLDVLAEPTEQVAESWGMACPDLTGHIEFRDVSLRYDDRSPWAVREVSLTVPAGTRMAVVGHSGSGKSTLVRLMLGLLRPDRGVVLFDGVDSASIPPATLRRQCGVVLQEPFLFNGSVRANIAQHDPDLPLADVHRAARLAAVHNDVLSWPMGYETQVGEGGAALSGGQRQRLALARALAHRPSILVLDEATSNLDAATEATVRDALHALGCTTITVAHRLSTIQRADVIVVMDCGRVVECGTHETLLHRRGHYAELVAHQLTRDVEHTSE